MDMTSIKVLLEALTSVGIDEAVLEPVDGGTLVRGANKDLNVIVYDIVDDTLVEYPLGIQSVRGLLSRLNLFETAKAVIEVEARDGRVVDIMIKQGRKKASYKCAEPSSLSVPKKVPGDLDITNSIVFNSEYVDHVTQAVSAMSFTGSKAERTVSIAVKDNVATFSIFDGEDDTFSDELDVDFPDIRAVSWEVSPFQRVMKQALDSNSKECRFTITEYGIAVFDLSGINILVAPVSR